MDAQQARELAKQRSRITDIQHRELYVKIIDQIKEALGKKECYDIVWYEDLPQPVKNMLERDGYKVSGSTWQNESHYTISWSE